MPPELNLDLNKNVVDKKPNKTTVIELNGINTAAITGDKSPCAAK